MGSAGNGAACLIAKESIIMRGVIMDFCYVEKEVLANG